MGRRFARMKLLAGNDIKFKVEIVPIDNQQDHYYLMTQNGAPIVKIMPPGSNTASDDQSMDEGVFDLNY
jgi:Ser/Thr protein kinase RdoA (MazF antagonist)